MDNKTILTIHDLKKKNQKEKNDIYYGIPFVLILFGFLIFSITSVIQELKNDNSIVFFIPFFCLIIFGIILILYLMYKKNRNEKKENIFIENNNFKIVEDRIYDRYLWCHTDKDGHNSYHYYIYTKIYGSVYVDEDIYHDCKKDDSIYLLFYNGDEQNNQYCNKENKRNDKNIDQFYLSSKYDLSQELLSYFIPYNESLGKINYNLRINDLKKGLEEGNDSVLCKKCYKNYKLNKYEYCPKCGEKYKFDISDVMDEHEWYEKE